MFDCYLFYPGKPFHDAGYEPVEEYDSPTRLTRHSQAGKISCSTSQGLVWLDLFVMMNAIPIKVSIYGIVDGQANRAENLPCNVGAEYHIFRTLNDVAQSGTGNVDGTADTGFRVTRSVSALEIVACELPVAWTGPCVDGGLEWPFEDREPLEKALGCPETAGSSSLVVEGAANDDVAHWWADGLSLSRCDVVVLNEEGRLYSVLVVEAPPDFAQTCPFGECPGALTR